MIVYHIRIDHRPSSEFVTEFEIIYIGLPDSIGIGSCVSTAFDTMESIIPKESLVQRRSPMGIFGRNLPVRI